MERFKLQLFKFPGCYVACNTEVIDGGDFKEIAHISFAGNIKYLVSQKSIPQTAIESIESLAETNREKFITKLDNNIKLFTERRENEYHDPYTLLTIMLDKLTLKEQLDFGEQHYGEKIENKIKALREIYIERS